MPVAKAEEHQVAIEVQEVGLPERKVLMDESQIGKTQRTRIENVSWYGFAFTWLPLPIFSGIWHGKNGSEDIPTTFNLEWLSHENFPF